MKKIILLAITSLILVSCNRIGKEERVLVKEDTDLVFVFDIPKAGCKNCQRVVEGGLENEKGVKQSILNLNTKQVSIVYQPDVTTREVLEKRVTTLMSKIPCK